MKTAARRAFAFAGLLSWIVLASSCGADPDSVVLVHVDGDATLPGIVRLRATLSNAEVSDSKLFPAAAPVQAIALPTAFSITLARARAGDLDIALDALDAQGDIVGNGAARVAIQTGGRAEVTITLAAGATLCGDGHLDPGEACDDGDRITNGTCDFRCRPRAGATGDAGSDTADARDAGGGDISVGGGAGGHGSGGISGSGGTGAGGGGTGGGISGTGGRGTGGGGTGGTSGAGGISGTGGAGVGGISGTGGAIVTTGAGGAGGCSVDLLTNGTFDAGEVGWVVSSPINTRMIYLSGDSALGGFTPSSPYYLAFLGRNLTNGEETLSQSIHVPATANTLTMLGFFHVPVDPTNSCPTCSAGTIEIVQGTSITPVKAWTNQEGNTAWTAFSTTLDAVPLRNATVTFRLRAIRSSALVTPLYFDSLTLKADRCP